jgi:2-dehydropantoate 2-reductase
MKHAILGAGAIGGLLGTALSSLGEDVTVLVRPGTLSDYPPNLVLERPSGRLAAPARAASALTERVDALWIATKTYQLQSALESVQATPGAVVPLLNGVDHVAKLRERFGRDRVIPATIAVEAEKEAAGRFIQRSAFVRLNLAAAGQPLLGAAAGRLESLGFTCKFVSNEATLLWSKLCFLAPFALATSASGLAVGELLSDPAWRQKLDAAVSEACAVAKASGADVDAARLLAVFDDTPPGARSSMQKDVEAGRPLELDEIAGPIVRGGESRGLDVSATRALIAEIQERAASR